MLNKDIEVIKIHIERWGKEREALDDLIGNGNAMIYKIRKKEYAFKCPDKKQKGICIGCENAIPLISQAYSGVNGVSVRYPGGKEMTVTKFEITGRTCFEWRKKEIPAVCGCGGKYRCECGYVEGFCVPTLQEPKICPFCGRTVTIERFKSLFNNMMGRISLKQESF